LNKEMTMNGNVKIWGPGDEDSDDDGGDAGEE